MGHHAQRVTYRSDASGSSVMSVSEEQYGSEDGHEEREAEPSRQCRAVAVWIDVRLVVRHHRPGRPSGCLEALPRKRPRCDVDPLRIPVIAATGAMTFVVDAHTDLALRLRALLAREYSSTVRPTKVPQPQGAETVPFTQAQISCSRGRPRIASCSPSPDSVKGSWA